MKLISTALRILAFAYDNLDYKECPTVLPSFRVGEKGLKKNEHGRIELEFPPVIYLKAWDHGASYWQGVLAHEMAHYVQYYNDADMDKKKIEREALGLQNAWLIKIKAPYDAFPTEKTIRMLAG